MLLPLALVLTFICLIGALSSGLGVRFEWWDFRVGFSVLKWSAYLVGVPLVIAVIGAVSAKLTGGKLLSYQLVLVAVICIGVLAVPYKARQEFRKYPTLADATTSFEDPPAFVDLVATRTATAANPLEYRAGDAIEKQQAYFPGLTTWESTKSPGEIINHAASIAEDIGMHIAAVAPEEGRLEATDTTFWFRFKDDVVVRARLSASGATQVDIRSASRVGYLDGGVNAKRVQRFLAELSKE